MHTGSTARQICSLSENLPFLRKSDTCLSTTKNELSSRTDSHAVAIGLNFDSSRLLLCRQTAFFTEDPDDNWGCIPDSLEQQYHLPADLTSLDAHNRPCRNGSGSFLAWIHDER